MKPMPYTLYQSDESEIYGVRLPGSTEFRYLIGRSLDHRLEHKKLTEAECAAEYWHAAYCEAFTVINADLDTGMQFEHEADTWHRFATTPAAEARYE